MSQPTISVLIAAYRGADLIAETLDSLYAQSFSDFEVIVVDDCSPDETGAVARAYGDPRIRVVRAERNGGPVAARNLGVAHARGRYIAGLDHDDLCHPNRFARQVAFLEENPDIVLVSTDAMFLQDGVTKPSNRTKHLTPMLIDWLMLTQNPLIWSSVMLRADIARRLDPFERPERVYAEDFDLYQRLRPFGGFAEIDAPLVTYRKHAGSVSRQFTDRMLDCCEKVLAESHAALMGSADPVAISLIVRHVMHRAPVNDTETLNRLFAAIEKLTDAFVAARVPPEAELQRIRREISRLWWRICRASVRSGALRLSDTMAVRPGSADDADGKSADLIVSDMLGQVRARRQARKTG